MPISKSWESFLRSLDKTYDNGKVVCRDTEGGGKICVHEKAWQVFYATLRKHKWDEKKSSHSLSIENPEDVKEVTDEPIQIEFSKMTPTELEVAHAIYHANSECIGDEACQKHFVVANEMIDRGILHINRSPCDVAVEMSRNLENIETDEEEMLRVKMRVCKAMMVKLSMNVPFAYGHFKGFNVDEQKKMIRSMARTIRRRLIQLGCKPKKTKKK